MGHRRWQEMPPQDSTPAGGRAGDSVTVLARPYMAVLIDIKSGCQNDFGSKSGSQAREILRGSVGFSIAVHVFTSSTTVRGAVSPAVQSERAEGRSTMPHMGGQERPPICGMGSGGQDVMSYPCTGKRITCRKGTFGPGAALNRQADGKSGAGLQAL